MIYNSVYTNSITLTVDEVVTGGKVNAVIMLGSLPYQKSFDICNLLEDIQMSCPVTSGKISFGIKLKVPEYTPSVSDSDAS